MFSPRRRKRCPQQLVGVGPGSGVLWTEWTYPVGLELASRSRHPPQEIWGEAYSDAT